ncbi:ArgS-related anticodon-binding protein NrtL [Streptomyces sp. MJP52]|uniref:ArgS-related anticodon-binding protein NrtL n=1 Tax=Streptomyces sp. MJP52 TaxID=2940555 RepID=UPI0024755355|nr:DALR anticodon-binding domain-containing protein [Streptomyces sp. MJP52]MDH6224968.1 arginyl-tRNA synthetase [Streptomyces sp. MJP52]
MTPVELSHTVLHAVRSAVDEGELAVAVPETVKVAPPGPGGCGDYATNVALRLAQPAGRPAAEVAEVLRARLLRAGGVRDVAVTGPGFLNISLAGDADAALVRRIRDEGMRYGHGDALAGRTVTLRVPREIRAEVVAEVTARLIGAQGGRARVTHVAHGEPADVRPVPAPGDPAPLGPAAARWALLHPAPHDRPSLGGEHLAQREDNPLFRVRYAHARARAAARNAAQLGFTAEPGPMDTAADTPATAATAPALLRVLADHPRVLAQAARAHAPDRLARHLVTVADATLEFLTHAAVLPTGEEKPSAAHRARLALAEAAGTVLAGGLTLLGIDAPEHL